MKRSPETILQEKLAAGKSLGYVRALAVAIGRDDLRTLVEKKMKEKKQAA